MTTSDRDCKVQGDPTTVASVGTLKSLRSPFFASGDSDSKAAQERPDAHNLHLTRNSSEVYNEPRTSRYAVGVVNVIHARHATGRPPSPAQFETKLLRKGHCDQTPFSSQTQKFEFEFDERSLGLA